MNTNNHPPRSRLETALTKPPVLIPFLTAGYPTLTATVPLLHALVEGGAEVIELGIPFSDPMADGPIIEAAGHLALAQGVNLGNILQMVREFRQQDDTTPVVLMGYANPLEVYGVEAFATNAHQAGVDAVLVVDLPPEEASTWQKRFAHAGLAMIYLIAPNTPEARIADIARHAMATPGYLYTVSLKGVTGSSAINLDAVREQVAKIRAHTSLPIAVGFGVRTAEQVNILGQCADGVIVGSRLIELLGEAWQKTPEINALCATAREFIQSLKTS